MASNNGVITSPVIHEKTTGDIQQVINAEGTDDLETLCKSSAVKWLSRYKPTEYTNGMINQLTSSEQRETQAKGTMVTQNGTNLRCSFGINIPFAIVPLSAFTDQGMVFLQADAFAGYMAGQLRNYWTRITPSVYRQGDFYGYTHNTPLYPIIGGSKPFRVSNMVVLRRTTLKISASAMLSYNFADAYENISIAANPTWLGVFSLFDGNNNSYESANPQFNLYFGFALYADSPARICFTSSALEQQLTRAVDPTTGQYGVRYAYTEDIPATSTKDHGFVSNEDVWLIPYIRKDVTIGGVTERCFFALDGAWIQTKIPGSSIQTMSVTLTNVTIVMTYTKLANGNIAFYLNAANDLNFTCTGYSTLPSTNQILFSKTAGLAVTPGDAQGYVQAYSQAQLGGNINDDYDLRYSNITTQYSQAGVIIPHWSVGSRLDSFYTELKYDSSVRSAKVNISFSVYHRVDSAMAWSNVNMSATFDPQDISNGNTKTLVFSATV